jgi:hypothetical protein
MTKTDEKPAIPPEEYRQRWSRVQELMEHQQLDLLIAYADDRAVFGPAHARWLANFPVHFEPACVLVLKQGDPILLCGPESDQYALIAGQIRDVRVLREFTHPDEDYPCSKIQSLSEVVGEVISDPRSIRKAGLAGISLMGAYIRAAFERSFPQAKWLDIENALGEMRGRKQRPAGGFATLIESPRWELRQGLRQSRSGSPNGKWQPRSRRLCAGQEQKGRASIPSSLRGRIPGRSWRARPSDRSEETNWCC